MMKSNLCVLIAAALLTPVVQAENVSPWLPGAGSGDVSLAYVAQSADEFFAGSAEMPLPTDLEQDSLQIGFSYGINERLALDIRAGYAESDFLTDPGLAPQGGLNGITDSRIGLRWLLLDEFADAPVTLTLGGAINIEGSYDTGAITAIGDGASGGELALAVGRQFDSGFSLSGEFGARQRGGDVPNEWFFGITAALAFTDNFSGFVGYEDVNSDGDLDIGAMGFSPARFPEVEEDYSLWNAGLSVAFNEAWSVSGAYGSKIDGRNTAKSDFWLIALNRSF
jgi:hypothetical protein